MINLDTKYKNQAKLALNELIEVYGGRINLLSNATGITYQTIFNWKRYNQVSMNGTKIIRKLAKNPDSDIPAKFTGVYMRPDRYNK